MGLGILPLKPELAVGGWGWLLVWAGAGLDIGRFNRAGHARCLYNQTWLRFFGGLSTDLTLPRATHDLPPQPPVLPGHLATETVGR